MRLGIVSDTHGHVRNTLAAVEVLAAHSVDRVIHCGDIGSTAIPGLFAQWPADYVLGNVDRNEAELRHAIEMLGQVCHGRLGELQADGVRIAFLHGDDLRQLKRTTLAGTFDLVCYGHTHCAEVHFEGKTLVLNPGAVYRANPHSIALVDLPTLDVNHISFGHP